FSAYRYIALQNRMGHKGEKGPLASYLNRKDENISIFSANRYLAEDRILCSALVTKSEHSWLLRYIKSSQAETDVPEDAIGLIRQRRRWINGSFFSGFNGVMHFYFISRSDHSIGNFYLAFHKLSQNLIIHLVPWSPDVKNGIFIALQYIYLSLIILQFILALGHMPQGPEALPKMLKEHAISVESSTRIPTVEISIPQDINDIYQQAVQEIRRKPSKDIIIDMPEQNRQNSNKLFRTKVLYLWVLNVFNTIKCHKNIDHKKEIERKIGVKVAVGQEFGGGPTAALYLRQPSSTYTFVSLFPI
ncbi:32777_t:CDS:2, partial [Racocetra persica]